MKDLRELLTVLSKAITVFEEADDDHTYASRLFVETEEAVNSTAAALDHRKGQLEEARVKLLEAYAVVDIPR